MKLFMGLIILLVTLVAVTGCTQTVPSSAQNATATTAPATEATTVATPVVTITTLQTTVPTTVQTSIATTVTTPATTVTTKATTAPVKVTPTVTAASGVTKIRITSAGFTPQTDVVLPGTGIFWINDDNTTHSIKTIGNNTGMFNSGDILPNGQFSYTFSEKTGTYTYAFADNTSITGTIIVKAGRSLSG